MEACVDEKPDVLIIEGTRIDEESSMKEIDVEDEVSMILSKSQGLNVCNWPVRDTDRMMSFFNSAKKSGKTLAISLKQAYLINLMKDCEDAIVPDLKDENVALYAMRKSWGLIGSDWDDKIINEDYDSWERVYLKDTICHKEIKENQKDYMFFCTNFDLKELIDLKPIKGSVYIKSVCEPFDREMEIDWKRVNNWIEHFGMNLHKTHVSGHASAPQLKEFVKKVQPKMVVPVHSQHPEFYEKWYDKVRLLKGIGDNIELN